MPDKKYRKIGHFKNYVNKKAHAAHGSAGVPALHAVGYYPVEDAVQYHQHPYGQKLLAKVADVITDNAAVAQG